MPSPRSPILFGRRMKRWVYGPFNGWRLESGPFVFRVNVPDADEDQTFTATLIINDKFQAHRDSRSLDGALRSLTAMRDRLVRQLGDKA
jgi:hypothetical protein